MLTNEGGRMDVSEKIGVLTAKADAAHNRVDKLEVLIRDDLRELKADLKELNAYMHRSKGWAAAMIFAGGIVGGAITLVAQIIFKL